jgi:hypothetical protein
VPPPLPAVPPPACDVPPPLLAVPPPLLAVPPPLPEVPPPLPEPALQTPAVHDSLALHTLHAEPDVPQRLVVLPGSQTLFEQQPVQFEHPDAVAPPPHEAKERSAPKSRPTTRAGTVDVFMGAAKTPN